MRPRNALVLALAPVLLLAGGSAAVRPPGVGIPSYQDLHGVVAGPATYYAKPLPSTPQASCARGDRPEGATQGRVPKADFDSGRAAKGYTCNATVVGRFGTNGGFRVARYVDAQHHVCAFYDSTLIFPRDVTDDTPGTYVLDMTDVRHPVRTAVLRSPAMISPHESLRLNAGRGLLVAVMGTATAQVGFVDVWDVRQDCRHPVFRSSLPLALLGHEGAFSPDGMTYWASTTFTRGLTAIDLHDPSLPKVVWRSDQLIAHGLTLSEDGTRAYVAINKSWIPSTHQGGGGMAILDVSQVQRRVPNPTVRTLSYVTWPEVSIPQNVIPVTIKGRRYAIEFDEYDANVYQFTPRENVGGVRVFDISDERHPRVVSRIRLAVHNLAAREVERGDPGATQVGQGYASHYCEVPRRHDPGILACSMIVSGLRVFDIRDPRHPREVAYANQPVINARNPHRKGAYAMCAPAFDPARRQVWYSDTNSGFFVVQLSRAAWPT
ncbi:MAG TPA: hypothetical protein VMZ11_09570 [Mycobacteriales bacterium]|nr:hypothetical protein [Mycobacteriales bacterium]